MGREVPHRSNGGSARVHAAPVRGWSEFREPVFSGWKLPTSPFGRLALTHAVSASGDTLVSIALAKTLFFVSPDEARSKVLLYLVLTLAPFAVVSPFIGPFVDKHAPRRQWMVVATSAVRAVLCLLLARDYRGIGLFPEAFLLLVLSKAYGVLRASLVPAVVTRPNALVRANSKLSLVAGIGGFAAALIGGVMSLAGPALVLLVASGVFCAGALFAARLIVVDDADLRPFGREPGKRSRRRGPSFVTTMRLAALSMSVQRGLVGFVTFLIAFTLKREGAPTWWLGLMATAAMLGLLAGSGVAPRLRHRLDEMAMLAGGLALTAATAVVALIVGGRGGALLVASTTAFSAGVGRLAFDALIQRDGLASGHGAAFARFETRFQLAWVIGAIVPVAFSLSRTIGFGVMALLAAGAIAAQLGGEQSLRRIDSTLEAGRSRWRRPARPTDADWHVPDELP